MAAWGRDDLVFIRWITSRLYHESPAEAERKVAEQKARIEEREGKLRRAATRPGQDQEGALLRSFGIDRDGRE